MGKDMAGSLGQLQALLINHCILPGEQLLSAGLLLVEWAAPLRAGKREPCGLSDPKVSFDTGVPGFLAL